MTGKLLKLYPYVRFDSLDYTIALWYDIDESKVLSISDLTGALSDLYTVLTANTNELYKLLCKALQHYFFDKFITISGSIPAGAYYIGDINGDPATFPDPVNGDKLFNPLAIGGTDTFWEYTAGVWVDTGFTGNDYAGYTIYDKTTKLWYQWSPILLYHVLVNPTASTDDVYKKIRRVFTWESYKLIQAITFLEKAYAITDETGTIAETGTIVTAITDDTDTKQADTPTSLTGDLVSIYTSLQSAFIGQHDGTETRNLTTTTTGDKLDKTLKRNEYIDKLQSVWRTFLRSFEHLFLYVDPSDIDDVYETI